MFENIFKKTFVYSFDEILQGITESENKLDTIQNFTSVFGYLFNSTSEISTYWTSGNGKKLFDAIYNEHFTDIVVVSDKELSTVQDFKDASEIFGKKLYAIWRNTHEKYDKLISLYTAQENNLLNKLKSTSKNITRFNDTPENEGTFDDDEHTSNITQSELENETDTAPIIQRLDEIQRLYMNIIGRWIKDFDKLFISDLNYQRGLDDED